jgi:hypothetical protein
MADQLRYTRTESGQVYFDMAERLRERQRGSHEPLDIQDAVEARGAISSASFRAGELVECNCGGWQAGNVVDVLPGAYRVRLSESGVDVTVSDNSCVVRQPTQRTLLLGDPERTAVGLPSRSTPMLGNVDVLLSEVDAILKQRLSSPAHMQSALAPEAWHVPGRTSEWSHRTIQAIAASPACRPNAGRAFSQAERREMGRRYELADGEDSHRATVQSVDMRSSISW